MQRCSRAMAKPGGHLAGKAARLLQRLEDASSSLSPVEACPGHGGYRATHVILVPGRTVTFDLDTYDIGDPARDLARFLSALRSQALGQLGSIRALDRAAEVFLETYLAEGPPDAKKNLCFFEAAACLKRAKHSLDRSLPHWREKTEAMLDEGLRILEQEAA
jgi:aminoglycoside phosphotransferase (APT) family kinase protein